MVAHAVDPRLAVRYSDVDHTLDEAMEQMEGAVYHDEKTEFVAPDPEYKDRAPPPSKTKVARVRFAYFTLVLMTLFLTWWRITATRDIKSVLMNPSLYEDHQPLPENEPVRVEMDAETREMCLHLDVPTPECLDAIAPPAPVDYWRSASHARRNMLATLTFSQICDVITGVFFAVATGTSVLLTWQRSCGMKDAELRGMAICVLACVSMAFSIIGTVVSATVFVDKRDEVLAMRDRAVLPPTQLWVARDMAALLWLQVAGGVLACISHVVLGLIAVYYADEYTGDSLYLPVKSFAKTSTAFFGW